ncbi:MAG: hypothetical protein JWQ07_4035 [Ramlibacter sp.]|nr:hypothetical protein [Ramlibacter sp.]
MNRPLQGIEWLTIEEVARRLKLSVEDVWRKLESGDRDFPAGILADILDGDGEILRFDYALLSPEGVRHVVAINGADRDLKWPILAGNRTALARRPRMEMIRILSPYLPTRRLPDPERRLARLRSIGGEVHRNAAGGWSIKKIGELVELERSEARGRADPHTVRSDLRNAAEAEHAAQRAGGQLASWHP